MDVSDPNIIKARLYMITIPFAAQERQLAIIVAYIINKKRATSLLVILYGCAMYCYFLNH